MSWAAFFEFLVVAVACTLFVRANSKRPRFHPLFRRSAGRTPSRWVPMDYVVLFAVLWVLVWAVSIFLLINQTRIEENLGMSTKMLVFKHTPHMKWLVSYRKWFAQSTHLYWIIWVLGGAESRAAHAEAAEYYEKQRPHFLKAVAQFKMHSHYVDMREAVKSYGPSAKWDFHGLIAVRARIFRENYEKHGWEDFRIEKDKCDMYKFFIMNGLPHPKVLKMWETLGTAKAEIKDLMLAQDAYPLYTKFCHLTTGNALSVVPTKKKSDVEDPVKFKAWMGWLQRTWNIQSDDWDRVWSDDFNTVVQTLKPGIMLQRGYTVPALETSEQHIKDSGAAGSVLDPIQNFWLTQRLLVTQPTELKVEVLFGFAYIVQVAGGSGEEEKRCPNGAIITRGGLDKPGAEGPAIMKQYEGSWKHEVAQPKGCYEWILSEAHLPRVIHIAESAAIAAGIDAMRIDIFINKGQPAAAVINENSLSSAADYQWATPFLAKAWQEGHLAGTSKVMDPNVDSHKWSHGKEWYATEACKCDPKLLPAEMPEGLCKDSTSDQAKN